MLVIRLSLSGSKKRPFYHLTVTDSRKPRDGSNKEKIGFFNPMARGQDVTFSIKADRLKYWLDVGAQMSQRVSKLVKNYNQRVA